MRGKDNMPNNPNEPEIARPESWKTVEMPATVDSLLLNKTYTSKEFSILARGFVPEVCWHGLPRAIAVYKGSYYCSAGYPPI